MACHAEKFKLIIFLSRKIFIIFRYMLIIRLAILVYSMISYLQLVHRKTRDLWNKINVRNQIIMNDKIIWNECNGELWFQLWWYENKIRSFLFPKISFSLPFVRTKGSYRFLCEARDIKQQCSQENTLKEKSFRFFWMRRFFAL